MNQNSESNAADHLTPIGLHLSMPDGLRLPIDALVAAHERVLRNQGRSALEYGGSQGFEGLREWIAAEHNATGSASAGPQNIVLTNGASGGLDDLCDATIEPGDVIITEQPTFSGSLRTLLASGAEVVGIDIDENGLDPDDLERTVRDIGRTGKRIKLLYVVANFNNPTAALLSFKRRTRIAEICRAAQILVVQDDTFADLSLGPEVPPSFWSIMQGESVAVLGTFSKTLAPGLRLGWVVAQDSVTEIMVRRRLDLGVSPLTARVVAEFCTSGGYRSHIDTMRSSYRCKRDLLMAELSVLGSRLGTWNRPEGGFSLWVELAPALDALRLRKAAADEGVLIAAGRGFFVDEPRGQAIRLCFSNASEAELKESVRRLGRALDAVQQSLCR